VRLILGPIERCDGLPVLAAEPFLYRLLRQDVDQNRRVGRSR
jgi:hypothetical protein